MMAPENFQWMTPQTTTGALTTSSKPSGDDPDRPKDHIFKLQNEQKTEKSCDECSSAHRKCVGQSPNSCEYCRQVGKSCSYERDPQANGTTSTPAATADQTSPAAPQAATSQPATTQPVEAHVGEGPREEDSMPLNGAQPQVPTTTHQPYQPQGSQNLYPGQVPGPVSTPMNLFPGTTHGQYAPEVTYYPLHGHEAYGPPNNPGSPYPLPQHFNDLNGNNDGTAAHSDYPPLEDDSPDGTN